MNGTRKQGMRLFWTLFFVFWVVLLAIGTAVNIWVLPRGHWLAPLTSSFAGWLAFFSASLATASTFRRRGLSRETRFEMTWPNARREEDGPPAEFVLRPPTSLRWIMLACGGLLLALIGAVYFGIPADQQIGRETVPLGAAVIAVASVGVFWLFSLPAMRLDGWGIREMGGRKAAWSRVATCQVEVQRNVFGEAYAVSLRLLDAGDRRGVVFSLLGFEKPQQREFLLALHHALQPGQDAPDLAQVLGDDAQGASST